MTLRVQFVVPDGEIWSGTAEMVIAKTLDGDIGVLTGHTPVLGILAEGSVVRIIPEGATAEAQELVAAVNGGFFSVADDRVSILAQQARLGEQVDTRETRAALDGALQALPTGTAEVDEPADVRYYRALLRAAGNPADRA